ncbi:LytTR family DNA-binding domain-containing protein [Lactobacillus agrestimuris]|uniref:LytTR family DNA-binding domain-containing protein n=1 Tax=Lactobacillus agrestimuris TaxID=2941328 RepID=UPI0020449F53|nr:LytTR family DNA-binding domain-containing protein [Lactobacillus agrestimuris]
MKINCHVDASLDKEYGELWIRKITPEVNDLLNYLTNNEQVLWCAKDNELKPIAYRDIFAIQTNDQKLDVSTIDDHYIYRKRLSVLKDELNEDFIEASQSAIFNFRHIDHLELQDNGTIDVILKNKQRIPIARRKVRNLKKRLGI